MSTTCPSCGQMSLYINHDSELICCNRTCPDAFLAGKILAGTTTKMEPDPGCKPVFFVGQRVTHMATQNPYRILETPAPNRRLERSNEPYYRYVTVGSGEPIEWVRPQEEMEDGRFVSTQEVPGGI